MTHLEDLYWATQANNDLISISEALKKADIDQFKLFQCAVIKIKDLVRDISTLKKENEELKSFIEGLTFMSSFKMPVKTYEKIDELLKDWPNKLLKDKA